MNDIAGLIERAPFDHEDPFDVMADQFRRQMAEMALRALKTTLYRELTQVKQIECFLSGTMTGIIGVCFASIQVEGRDAMMEYMVECLPAARALAEGIMADGESAALKARTTQGGEREE